MSGNKCQYYGCGLSQRIAPSIRLFSFPVKDTERCKKWILHSGNRNLADLSLKSLRRTYICSNHFTAEQIVRKNLFKDAVPVRYTPSSSESETEEVMNPEFTPILNKSSTPKVYGSSKQVFQPTIPEWPIPEKGSSDDDWLKEIESLPKEPTRKHVSLIQENKKLKKDLQIAITKVNSLQSQLRMAKKKLLKAELSARFFFTDTSIFSKVLLNMQLRHQTRNLWTSQERNTALSIYYKSPSCYSFLIKRGLILPDVSTIKKWAGIENKMMSEERVQNCSTTTLNDHQINDEWETDDNNIYDIPVVTQKEIQ